MGQYYGDTCGEINRKSGTLCRGKGTKSIGAGSKRRYVCSRHNKQWDADRDQELRELKRDHQMGLHAENKEAFLGDPMISEEYNITRCQDCLDETRAEKYGVKPEEAFKAGMIENAKQKDRENYERLVGRMAEAAKDFNASYFIQNYGEELVTAEAIDGLWQRVQRLMDEGESESWSAPKVKLNIVEAYTKVLTECTHNLIRRSSEDDDAFRQFIRRVSI